MPSIRATSAVYLVELTHLDGDGPAPMDGAFRMLYTLASGGAPLDAMDVRVRAGRPDRGTSGVEVRLPSPKPLSAPADGVTLTLVLPP